MFCPSILLLGVVAIVASQLPTTTFRRHMNDRNPDAETFRVALVSDNSCGFAALIDDDAWCAEHNVTFPLVVEISAQPWRERLRRIHKQTIRQAKINEISSQHQLCSAIAYRLWFQPSSSDGHLESTGHASVVRATSANDKIAIAAIREARVDAVVLLSADLLTARSIEEIPAPLYNVHDGDPSHVRGRPPFLWDIIDGRHETLIALHEVVPQVDSGAIIQSQAMPIIWSSSLRATLRSCEQHAVAVRIQVVKEGLAALRAGAAYRTTFTPGRLRTLPSFTAIRVAARRCRDVARASSAVGCT